MLVLAFYLINFLKQKTIFQKKCAKYVIKRTDEMVLPYLQATFPNLVEYNPSNKLQSKFNNTKKSTKS